LKIKRRYAGWLARVNLSFPNSLSLGQDEKIMLDIPPLKRYTFINGFEEANDEAPA
jgi:hypothetical protein